MSASITEEQIKILYDYAVSENNNTLVIDTKTENQFLRRILKVY